jgi:hypothetical protein
MFSYGACVARGVGGGGDPEEGSGDGADRCQPVSFEVLCLFIDKMAISTSFISMGPNDIRKRHSSCEVIVILLYNDPGKKSVPDLLPVLLSLDRQREVFYKKNRNERAKLDDPGPAARTIGQKNF